MLAISAVDEVKTSARLIPWKTLTQKKGQKGRATNKATEERTASRPPASMKVLSGILNRAFPTKGLKIKEETLKIPIRIPISDSPALSCDRKIGRVGMRTK